MQASALTTALAGIRRDERIDAASRSRLGAAAPPPRAALDVTIRLARPGDDAALARLRELDGRGETLAGDVVVAVAGGSLVAARGLRGGALSDPFRSGPEIAALLDVRVRQLTDRAPRARRPHAPRRRMPTLRVGGAR